MSRHQVKGEVDVNLETGLYGTGVIAGSFDTKMGPDFSALMDETVDTLGNNQATGYIKVFPGADPAGPDSDTDERASGSAHSSADSPPQVPSDPSTPEVLPRRGHGAASQQPTYAVASGNTVASAGGDNQPTYAVASGNTVASADGVNQPTYADASIADASYLVPVAGSEATYSVASMVSPTGADATRNKDAQNYVLNPVWRDQAVVDQPLYAAPAVAWGDESCAFELISKYTRQLIKDTKALQAALQANRANDKCNSDIVKAYVKHIVDYYHGGAAVVRNQKQAVVVPNQIRVQAHTANNYPEGVNEHQLLFLRAKKAEGQNGVIAQSSAADGEPVYLVPVAASAKQVDVFKRLAAIKVETVLREDVMYEAINEVGLYAQFKGDDLSKKYVEAAALVMHGYTHLLELDINGDTGKKLQPQPANAQVYNQVPTFSDETFQAFVDYLFKPHDVVLASNPQYWDLGKPEQNAQATGLFVLCCCCSESFQHLWNHENDTKRRAFRGAVAVVAIALVAGIIVLATKDWGDDTAVPTPSGTAEPITVTEAPTEVPRGLGETGSSTAAPAVAPTTAVPTHLGETGSPTMEPTVRPTDLPSEQPTVVPTRLGETGSPTTGPTVQPTDLPSVQPTGFPSGHPTNGPSLFPTCQPSVVPSSSSPTGLPSDSPTGSPSDAPTRAPSLFPTTASPTGSPTVATDPCVDVSVCRDATALGISTGNWCCVDEVPGCRAACPSCPSC